MKGGAMANLFEELQYGLNDFTTIIESKSLYIDKTAFFAKMIDSEAKSFFLARPRSFGRSLSASTLKAIFSGRKDLFENLAILKRLSEEKFAPRPVIRLDMGHISTIRNASHVKPILSRTAKTLAGSFGFSVKGSLPAAKALAGLFENLAQKNGQKVAILIDGADAPGAAFPDSPPSTKDLIEANAALRDFYQAIELADDSVSFVFAIGIDRNAPKGPLSSLNGLVDLSIDPEYGAICGFTEEEIRGQCAPLLRAAEEALKISQEELLDELRDRYEGFSFDGIGRVYCPYSVLSFFQELAFKNFWPEVEDHDRFARFLLAKSLLPSDLRGLKVRSSWAASPNALRPAGALYQAGYLSLRATDSPDWFYLDISNREARESLADFFALNVYGDEESLALARKRLVKALSLRNPSLAIEEFNRLFAAFPFKKYLAENEKAFEKNHPGENYADYLARSALSVAFEGAGLSVEDGETKAFRHRDLLVKIGARVWIVALKTAPKGEETETAIQALGSLLSQRYSERHANPLLLGLAIDGSTRTVAAFRARGDPDPRLEAET
jgi:hypothetical protein